MTDAQMVDHLAAIDFTKPVQVVKLGKGTELTTYVFPGNPLGSYYTEIGAPANQLGIYINGRIETTVRLTDDLTALKSTAGDTVDSWSCINMQFIADMTVRRFSFLKMRIKKRALCFYATMNQI